MPLHAMTDTFTISITQHSHGTETYCVSDTTGAEDLCHQENGEWLCESESATASEEVVDGNGCVQHGEAGHWRDIRPF